MAKEAFTAVTRGGYIQDISTHSVDDLVGLWAWMAPGLRPLRWIDERVTRDVGTLPPRFA